MVTIAKADGKHIHAADWQCNATCNRNHQSVMKHQIAALLRLSSQFIKLTSSKQIPDPRLQFG